MWTSKNLFNAKIAGKLRAQPEFADLPYIEIERQVASITRQHIDNFQDEMGGAPRAGNGDEAEIKDKIGRALADVCSSPLRAREKDAVGFSLEAHYPPEAFFMQQFGRRLTYRFDPDKVGIEHFKLRIVANGNEYMPLAAASTVLTGTPVAPARLHVQWRAVVASAKNNTLPDYMREQAISCADILDFIRRNGDITRVKWDRQEYLSVLGALKKIVNADTCDEALKTPHLWQIDEFEWQLSARDLENSGSRTASKKIALLLARTPAFSETPRETLEKGVENLLSNFMTEFKSSFRELPTDQPVEKRMELAKTRACVMPRRTACYFNERTRLFLELRMPPEAFTVTQREPKAGENPNEEFFSYAFDPAPIADHIKRVGVSSRDHAASGRDR